LLRLALPEVVRDATPEAILIGAIDLGLDGDVLLLQPEHGRAVKTLFVVLALPQRFGDPVRDFCRDLDPLNDVREELGKILLSDVRIAAAALEAGAVVVD